ncbi:uncharacterized protein LOC105219618 isoform X2 [Zeugodacus cucurbitae]|uniref:uncharacterized protein LOC105219618 isoform X2 n=1 Tax=Zeugodacus cucurbitae TaxID=28588 RepID=UPI0023D951C0|nr:uncharacterized protein LOC105219618 isoform X2 [Zeugodacus cucurbitae]
MDAVTGAQHSTSTLTRFKFKCVCGAQSYEMCSRRVKNLKQIMNNSNTSKTTLKTNVQMKVIELIMENLVEPTTRANKACNNSSLPNGRIAVTKTSTDTSPLYKKLLSFTLLTMLYFVFSLLAPALIEAAPVPWINACGYELAYDGANEQPANTTLGREERRVVLCQLRGNLTKQMRTLKPYMAPKNFSEVWDKHQHTYEFLKITRKNKIALVTWHKQLQVYALTVRHLLDRAINYKNLQSTIIHANKSVNQAEIDFQRLQHLNNVIRGMLCDVEMTASLVKGPDRNTTIDVIAAEARIQLKSEKRSPEEGIDQVDIDMVYSKFRTSILNMRNIINEKNKCARNGKRTIKSGRKTKRIRKD